MTNTVKVKTKIKVGYLVEMSNKTKIQIDPDELPIVLRSISEGKIVKVRQGFFNPSFFVDIVKDVERTYSVDRGADEELRPLDDIFGGHKLIEAPGGFKRLS